MLTASASVPLTSTLLKPARAQVQPPETLTGDLVPQAPGGLGSPATLTADLVPELKAAAADRPAAEAAAAAVPPAGRTAATEHAGQDIAEVCACADRLCW